MKRIFYLRLLPVALFCLGTALVLGLLPALFDTVLPVAGPPAQGAPAARETPVAQKDPPPVSSPVPSAPAPSAPEGPVSTAGEAPPSAPEAPVSSREPEPPSSTPEVPAGPVTPPKAGEEWAVRLVNWENPLPMDYEPAYEVVQNRFVMDSRAAPAARRMIADAWAQGVTLVVNSAYRPYSAQQRVYDAQYQEYLAQGYSQQDARLLTESYVAVPGHSEHQLGLAMDISAVDDGKGSEDWLSIHAPDYGFILRYPADKTEVTRTAYESWHYRYVGTPIAREITDQGLCLEEYLELLEVS